MNPLWVVVRTRETFGWTVRLPPSGGAHPEQSPRSGRLQSGVRFPGGATASPEWPGHVRRRRQRLARDHEVRAS